MLNITRGKSTDVQRRQRRRERDSAVLLEAKMREVWEGERYLVQDFFDAVVVCRALERFNDWASPRGPIFPDKSEEGANGGIGVDDDDA